MLKFKELENSKWAKPSMRKISTVSFWFAILHIYGPIAEKKFHVRAVLYMASPSIGRRHID